MGHVLPLRKLPPVISPSPLVDPVGGVVPTFVAFRTHHLSPYYETMFKSKAGASVMRLSPIPTAVLDHNGITDEVEIKEEAMIRESPDSSTDPWGCPQCGETHDNEARLVEHLLDEHQIRVVPPQSPSTTRCPVCRKHVADLSQHF